MQNSNAASRYPSNKYVLVRLWKQELFVMVFVDSWRVFSLSSETTWIVAPTPQDSMSGSLLPPPEFPHILPPLIVRFAYDLCQWLTASSIQARSLLWAQGSFTSLLTVDGHPPGSSDWASTWVNVPLPPDLPSSCTPSCGQWDLTSQELFEQKPGHHPWVLSPFDYCLLEVSEHRLVPYCHCSRLGLRPPNALMWMLRQLSTVPPSLPSQRDLQRGLYEVFESFNWSTSITPLPSDQKPQFFRLALHILIHLANA